MFDFNEALKNLPDNPGVYIMKNSDEEIIYIGKAISLKNRVRQYFQSSKNHSPKVRAMVSHIAEFEYVLVDSELEALILECNLIKKHKPKYNVLLKDDKHYPYIKITLNETYPRIIVTRKLLKDGAKYFGPYTDASAVRETIQIIKKLYQIRSCNKSLEYGKKVDRPCLNHHIGRCTAPCSGKIESEDYMDMIKQIIMFLSGKHDELINRLKEKMGIASQKLDFEKAAEFRDQIISIQKVKEKQKVLSAALEDQDVIAFSRGDTSSCIEIFFIRGGKLLGRENFYFDDVENEDELLSQFIMQFYSDREYVPRDILLQREISEINIIEAYLSNKRGSKVHIKVPKRGDKNELVEMAKKNADAALEQFKYRIIRDRQMTTGAVEELQSILLFSKSIHRIEAFDISNIQGTDSVGSMVVFEGGKPKNKDYRRFKIKTVNGPDDYKSMQEVVERRFKRALSDIVDEKFAVLPDLILIDGGEGQVSSVQQVLDQFNINIPVCGMVKDDRHRTRGLMYNGQEIIIPSHSNAFKLVTRIQDEAHRVAISYHRSLRSKNSVLSEIDDIKGIGKKRRMALMKHFESIDDIKKANIEELKSVDGMNEKAALAVYQYFRNEMIRSDSKL